MLVIYSETSPLVLKQVNWVILLDFKLICPSKKTSSIAVIANITFRIDIINYKQWCMPVLTFYYVIKLLIQVFFQINGFGWKTSRVKQEFPHGRVPEQSVVMKYKLCLYLSQDYW